MIALLSAPTAIRADDRSGVLPAIVAPARGLIERLAPHRRAARRPSPVPRLDAAVVPAQAARESASPPGPTGPRPARPSDDLAPYLLDRARGESGIGPPPIAGSAGTERGEGPDLDVSLPRSEAVETPAPAFLQRALGLGDAPLSVRGWVQNSFTGNPADPPDGINFGVHPNRFANQWMGNQYYLIVERPLDAAGRPGLGFRVDSLLGNDWEFTKSYGFADGAFDPGQFTGFALPQAYAELHLPILTEGGLDVRGGRWYSPAGFEAVQAIERPLLSVSYLFNFTPFTFFGVLATQHLDERTDFYLGGVNGWDRFIDANYRWNLLAGLTRESADGRTRLSIFGVVGPNQLPAFPPADATFLPVGVRTSPEVAGLRNFSYPTNDRVYVSAVLTRDWTARLTQAMEVAWARDRDTPLMRGPGSRRTGALGTRQDTEWYGFVNWFLYELDPKLTGVWRSEVFRDDDGVLLGTADTYYEMTLGLIYKPRPCLWLRPEARLDWAETGTPFDAGRSARQITIAFDVIVLF